MITPYTVGPIRNSTYRTRNGVASPSPARPSSRRLRGAVPALAVALAPACTGIAWMDIDNSDRPRSHTGDAVLASWVSLLLIPKPAAAGDIWPADTAAIA